MTAYDAVFLGVGLGDDTDLALPGDDLDGVWESLRFVEALKNGEPLEIGQSVAVIGGGNTAIDVARESLRLGAERVTVIYRRTRREMPAYAFEIDEAMHEGVRFAWRSLPVRLIGRSGSRRSNALPFGPGRRTTTVGAGRSPSQEANSCFELTR